MSNYFRMTSLRCATGVAALFLLAPAHARAMAPLARTFAANPADNSAPQSIGAAWDSLLKDTIPQTTPDPVLTAPQVTYETSPAGDFLNHFFMNGRTEYLRTQTFFSGRPTATGVIDAPIEPVFNPNGVPFPNAFQPDTNIVYSFLNWGTRGWISDRVNTNFSFAYSQDLSHVTKASPELDIIDTFNSNRRLEWVSGYVDINGRPSDGIFEGTSLRVGRQAVYGAELAEMDGASFTMDRPKYSWTLYAGRRFTYFSDPAQRAMGGGNFLYRFNENSSLEYDTFYYIKGTNSFRYRQSFRRSWLLSAGFRMVGSYPVDFTADGIWTPPDGNTSLRVSFAQKITNKDYFYDYTFSARDFDFHNPLLRLNLEALHPHTQFIVDGSRKINTRLRVGGIVWIRRLDDRQDVGPFDTSFEDVRANAQIFPWNKTDLLVSYHFRHSDDRGYSTPPTQFDDLTGTGETQVQDVSVEIGRTFMDGRLHLQLGGFYRQLDFKDQFLVITDARNKGLVANASFNLDTRTRIYMDYGLDTDYAVFRPAIQNSQTFRFGMAWRY